MGMAKKLCAVALACGMALGVAGCAGSQAQADTPTDGYKATITSDMQGDTIALLEGEVRSSRGRGCGKDF